MKRRRTEGVFGFVILGVVVLLALFVGLLPGSDPREGAGSVRSAKPAGRRGVFLLFKKVGIDARAFSETPKDLPRDRSVLWLPVAPTDRLPLADHPMMAKRSPERIGLHSLGYYKSFVEAGGRLVIPAGNDTTRFLVDTLGIEEAETTGRDEELTDGVLAVRTSSGEDLELDAGAAGAFHALDPNGTTREIWSVRHGEGVRPFAVEFPAGAGSVVLLADDEFIANESIGKRDHALAAVRLYEEIGQGGTVLFSEYEAGRWDAPTPLSLFFGPNLVLAALHGIVLLAAFVWLHAFARGFPRDPEPLALFSPYLRARSLADTLERARRYKTLASLLRSGALSRLGAITRARAARATVALEHGSALQRVNREAVVALARGAGLDDLEPKLLDAFVTLDVKSRDELDALDHDLEQLEQEIGQRMAGAAARGR